MIQSQIVYQEEGSLAKAGLVNRLGMINNIGTK